MTDSKTCRYPECDRVLYPQRGWTGLDREQRRELNAQGIYAHGARGMCRRCTRRAREDGTYLDYERATVPRDVVVEEYRHMDYRADETRLDRCRRLAPRLGMTVKALEQALDRAGVVSEFNGGGYSRKAAA